MEKEEAQRRQWRVMGITAVVGFVVILVIGGILEADAPDESDYLPARPPPQAPAVVPAQAAKEAKPEPERMVVEYGKKFETKGGGVAAVTREKLELAQRIANQNDLEAFIMLIETDPQVVMLDDGMTVWVSEYEDVYRRAKVRFQGTTAEAWVSYSALRHPTE